MIDDSLPAPLVPADHDVRSLDGFMLNVKRLFASELLAIATPEECWAAFLLWCRAWQQVPAGSLPNDDRKLAGFSGAGSRWKKVRENALHGFVLCSDGRLYHRFLCEEVKRAYKSHMDHQARRETDKKRLQDWRAKRGQETQETGDETGFGTDDETGSVEIETKQDKTKQKLASKQITETLPRERLPSDWGERAAAARAASGLPEADLAAEWAKFIDRIAEEPTLDRWLGWVLKARAAAASEAGKAAAGLPEEPWPQRCRAWAEGHRWNPNWGPPPDDGACWAPPELVEEARRSRANGAASTSP